MPKILAVQILNPKYLSINCLETLWNFKDSAVEKFKKTYVYQSLKWHETPEFMIGCLELDVNGKESELPLVELILEK